VKVKIVAVDLNRETVGLQLECIPQGDELLGEAEGKLIHPVTVDIGISPEGTQKKVTFAGTDTGGIVDVDLDFDGNVENYPWDRHRTSLWVSATIVKKGEVQWIPVRFTAYGAWPGLDIKLHARSPQYGAVIPRELDIGVTRSHVTRMVVYFSIVLTWILIFSVVGMVVSVAFSGRRPDVAMLAYFGTLLFAMTAFRNALPGAPPMGTASDYLAFFWGYAVAIVAIGVVSVVWLLRRGATKDAAAQNPAGAIMQEEPPGGVLPDEVATQSESMVRADSG
jgi:hypothetical protein